MGIPGFLHLCSLCWGWTMGAEGCDPSGDVPLSPTHPRMLHWASTKAKTPLNQIPRQRRGNGVSKSLMSTEKTEFYAVIPFLRCQRSSNQLIIDYSQHPNTSPCAVAQIHPTLCLFENLCCKQGIVLLKKTFFYCLGLNIHKAQNVLSLCRPQLIPAQKHQTPKVQLENEMSVCLIPACFKQNHLSKSRDGVEMQSFANVSLEMRRRTWAQGWAGIGFY